MYSMLMAILIALLVGITVNSYCLSQKRFVNVRVNEPLALMLLGITLNLIRK